MVVVNNRRGGGSGHTRRFAAVIRTARGCAQRSSKQMQHSACCTAAPIPVILMNCMFGCVCSGGVFVDILLSTHPLSYNADRLNNIRGTSALCKTRREHRERCWYVGGKGEGKCADGSRHTTCSSEIKQMKQKMKELRDIPMRTCQKV